MSADGNTVSNIESKEEEMEKVSPVVSGSIASKESVQSEAKENLKESSDALKEMPEFKKMGKKTVAFPPINLNELTSILQDPSMPSQDLMKEVANKIKIRKEENENKASAVNNVNPFGIRNVLDCIMEESLKHNDHSSDEEEEGGQHEPLILEIPCDYCQKIFGSTMTLKTHVLMSHSQDDPSVLNRLRACIDEEKASELSPAKSSEGSKKAAKSENQDNSLISLKSRTAADLSSTTNTSSSKSAQSSLRKRNLSAEKKEVQEPKKINIDLIEAARETGDAQSSPSSPTQSTTSSAGKGGKRRSDSSTPSPSAKISKRSHRSRSKSGDSETEMGKGSVQLRRSSRRSK